jgi:hypothetical protein
VRSLVCLLALAACDKAPVDAREEILEAWRTGKLAPSALEVTQAPDVGADCKASTVNAVELLLCAYPSAADANAAEERGLAWVGDATGAAKVSGTVLVVVADRRKTDPTGKTINQLLKLTPK